MHCMDVSYQFPHSFSNPLPLLISNLFLIRHLTDVANDMNPRHNYSICCSLHQCENKKNEECLSDVSKKFKKIITMLRIAVGQPVN